MKNNRQELAQTIDRIRQLHSRRRFWHAHDEGAWYDTQAEAAADNDTPITDIGHTDICVHCGAMETEQGGDHLTALWPCPTIQAITQ